MATMTCPHCGMLQLVPNPAPPTLACMACRRPLPHTAPALQNPSGPLPPHVRAAPPVSQTPAPPPQPVIWTPPPVKLPTIQTVSPKTVPPQEPTEQPTKTKWIWHKYSLIGGVLALVLLGLGGTSYFLFPRTDLPEIEAETETESPIPVPLETKAPNPLEHVWTDGSKKALRKNNIKVRIEALEYYLIYGYDENKRLMPLGNQKYLAVRLQIVNQGQNPHRYIPWYGNTFDVDGRTTGAMLWDDRGEVYPVQIFSDVSSIHGQQFERFLGSRQEVSDVIVFALPEGTDLNEIKLFRLQLPAAAVGEVGAFRFELPRSMLKTRREDPGPN